MAAQGWGTLTISIDDSVTVCVGLGPLEGREWARHLQCLPYILFTLWIWGGSSISGLCATSVAL